MARKMNVKELASFAELAPKTIYNLVYSNQIPFERISEKRVVFDEAQIKEWLQQRKIESKIKRAGPRTRHEATHEVSSIAAAETASLPDAGSFSEEKPFVIKARTRSGILSIVNKYKFYILGLVVISVAVGGGLNRFLGKKEGFSSSSAAKLKFSSSDIESLISQSKSSGLPVMLPASERDNAKIELDYISNMRFKGKVDASNIRPLLVYILKNKEEYSTRSKTMDIIRPYIDDPEIRETLIQIMKKDKDPSIRLKAATVLSRVASKEDVKRAFLERVRDDESVAVKFKLLEAIENNLDKQMFDALKEILENEPNPTIKDRSRLILKKFDHSYA